MDIINKYTVFLFDMYGVLWNGKDFYEKALETLKTLKDKNRIVYILSNNSQLSDSLKKRVTEEYRDGVVTSGEVAKRILEEGKLNFKNKKDYKKVFIFGSKKVSLFDGTSYEVTENLDKADFVYISIPQLTEEEYKNYNGDKSIFKKWKNGNWDSIVIEPFLPYLEEYLNRKLPLLNVNPDYSAQEIDVNTEEVNFVIRQGAIAEKYRELGGEVVEFGKPNGNIYDFVFENIEKETGEKVDKNKVVMIGDTLRTDIKGANNAGIDSILFIETGVTSNELKELNNIEELYEKYDAKPTYVMGGVGDLLK